MKEKINNTPAVKNGGRLFRNDLYFIVALLVIVSVFGLVYYLAHGDGDEVVVTVDGAEFGRFSLTENVIVEIRTGEQESELNLLVIENGAAYVESATCPDGICAKHKPVSREGESIVCLPHRVIITVHTADEEVPDIIV